VNQPYEESINAQCHVIVQNKEQRMKNINE